MFKNVEKISKAIDLLVKVAEDTKDKNRSNELVNAIHNLSVVQQEYFGDLKENKGGNYNESN